MRFQRILLLVAPNVRDSFTRISVRSTAPTTWTKAESFVPTSATILTWPLESKILGGPAFAFAACFGRRIERAKLAVKNLSDISSSYFGVGC